VFATKYPGRKYCVYGLEEKPYVRRYFMNLANKNYNQWLWNCVRRFSSKSVNSLINTAGTALNTGTTLYVNCVCIKLAGVNIPSTEQRTDTAGTHGNIVPQSV
jgi:hypothetical protein